MWFVFFICSSIACFVVTTLIDKRTKVLNNKPLLKPLILGLIAGLFCVIFTFINGRIHSEGFVFISYGICILVVLYYGYVAGITCTIISVLYIIFRSIFFLEYKGSVAATIGLVVGLVLVVLYKKFIVKDNKSFLNVALVVLMLSNCAYIIVILANTGIYNVIDTTYTIKVLAFKIFGWGIISSTVTYFVTNTLSIKLDNVTIASYYKDRVDVISGHVSPAFRAVAFSALFVVLVAVYLFSCRSNVSNEFFQQELYLQNNTQLMEHVFMDDNTQNSVNIARYNTDAINLFESQLAQGSSVFDTDYHYVLCDDEFNVIGLENSDRIILPTNKNEPGVITIENIVLNSEESNTVSCLVMFSRCEKFNIVAFGPEKEFMFFCYYSNLMTLICMIFAYAFLTLVIGLIFKRFVGTNLKAITNSLENILDGSYESTQSSKSLSEFAAIEASIDKTVEQFKEKIREEAERYAADFELARQIQLNSLPHVFPPFPDHSEIDIFAKYRAAQQVGGDFYDYYFVDKNHLAFLIADVSGKGISAAMFMMKAKMAFMAYSETLKRPHVVVRAVNNYLCKDNDAKVFVTCIFGVLNTEDGTLDYVCAGHDAPLLLRRNAHIKAIKSNKGIMLGFVSDYQYEPISTRLKPDDILYLYTDGVSEAQDADSKVFGKQNLKKAIAQVRSEDNLEQICNYVVDCIDNFCGTNKQFDDITMLTVKYYSRYFDTSCDELSNKYAAEMSCSLANVTKTIEYFTDVCQKAKVRQANIFLLHTIVDELLSNVIKYSKVGCHNHIFATLTFDNSHIRRKLLRIELVDAGQKFNPFEYRKSTKDKSFTLSNPGGVGLQIVKAKAHSYDYKFQDGKNITTITLKQ